MAFTVTMPGGAREYQLWPYFRVLQHDGIDITRAARAPDPVTGKRWLPVWKTRAEAERFAAAVREESEDRKWKVYSLPDAEVSGGPLGPIELTVNPRSDGVLYGLTPLSRALIEACFPQANPVQSVFITPATQGEFEKTQGPIWDHVALILTGLSKVQIEHLGGYRLLDALAEDVISDIPPLSA